MTQANKKRSFARWQIAAVAATGLVAMASAAHAQSQPSTEGGTQGGPTIGTQRLPSLAPPPGPQQWSITLSGQYTTRRGETAGALPSAEINYQATPDLLLHFYQPFAFDKLSGGPTHYGPGDTELGVRYRFIQPDDASWRPAVSFYPLINLPTGSKSENLGTGSTHVFLPLWVAKTFGDWTPYGGGGYWINPGTNNKNWWFFDGGVERRLTPSFAVSGEVFHATSSKVGLKDTTGVNFGGTYDLTVNHHLLFSVGTGIQNHDDTNRFSAFAGYQLTF